MYARSNNKEIAKLLKELVANKWSVTGGGIRHYRATCPNPCECSESLAGSTVNRLAVKRARTYLKNHTCWQKTTAPAHIWASKRGNRP